MKRNLIFVWGIVILLSLFSYSVFANDDNLHTHSACGTVCQGHSDSKLHEAVSFQELSQAERKLYINQEIVKDVINSYYTLQSAHYYLAESIDCMTRLIIPEDSNVTLCLNGNDLTISNRIYLENNAVFTVCDCTGQGGIYASVTGETNSSYTLNWYGGHLYGMKTGAYDLIDINPGCQVNLYGGEWNNRFDATNAVENRGTLVLYDGTIIANNRTGIRVAEQGTVTMKGGQIISNKDKAVLIEPFVNQSETKTMSFFFEGGTIDGDISIGTKGEMTILESAAFVLKEGKTLQVDGLFYNNGSFVNKGTVNAYSKVESDAGLLFYGQIAEAANAAQEQEKATITILSTATAGDKKPTFRQGNVVLDLAGNSFSDPINIENRETKLKITDSVGNGKCTVNDQASGIISNYGCLELEGISIKGGQEGISNYGELIIRDCDIKAVNTAIRNYEKLTIHSGTISVSAPYGFAVWMEGASYFEMNDGIIKATEYQTGVKLFNETPEFETMKMNGGTIEGGISGCQMLTILDFILPDGYAFYLNGEEVDMSVERGSLNGTVTIGKKTLSSTGTTRAKLVSEDGRQMIEYPYFIQAYRDAQRERYNGWTLQLSDDISRSSALTVYGKNLKLDLAGHTLSFERTNVNYAMNVRKQSKLVLSDSGGNGKIDSKAAAQHAFTVAGELIIESGEIVSKAAGVYSKTGSIVMNGGTINAQGGMELTEYGNGSAVLNQGTIIASAYGVVVANKNHFQMNGGLIKSPGNVADRMALRFDGIYGGSSVTFNGGIVEGGISGEIRDLTLPDNKSLYCNGDEVQITEGMTVLEGTVTIGERVNSTIPKPIARYYSSDGKTVKEYSYLGSALGFASCDDGSTLVLLDDYQTGESIQMDEIINQAITIDLNGFSIEFTGENGFYFSEYNKVNFKNSGDTGGVIKGKELTIQNEGDLVLDGVTVQSDGKYTIQHNSNLLVVHNSTLKGEIALESNSNTVLLDGTVIDGTLKGKSSYPLQELLGENCYYVQNDQKITEYQDEYLFEQSVTVQKENVASVQFGDGQTMLYKELTAAMSKAEQEENAVVTLLKNDTVYQIPLELYQGRITLDLNGKVLRSTAEKTVIINQGAELKVTDSTFKQNGCITNDYEYPGTTIFVNDGILNFETGNITGDLTALYSENGTVMISGGVITGDSVGVHCIASELTVSGVPSIKGQRALVVEKPAFTEISGGAYWGNMVADSEISQLLKEGYVCYDGVSSMVVEPEGGLKTEAKKFQNGILYYYSNVSNQYSVLIADYEEGVLQQVGKLTCYFHVGENQIDTSTLKFEPGKGDIVYVWSMIGLTPLCIPYVI